MKSMSYQEIIARREKRRADEIAFAMRRPKIPASNPAISTQILILQWHIDELYKTWRAQEIAKAQATKEVVKPERAPGRGGRKSSILQQLGLA